MDFKVAGTVDGITAIQMDIKVAGITIEIMREAMAQAKKSRLLHHRQAQGNDRRPREELSQYAPRMIVLTINPDKIKDVIGPGGKVINKIIADTGVKIDIENDGGSSSRRPTASRRKGQAHGRGAHQVVKVGETYLGTVTRLMNFGAFVAILPGKEGLVHISQLAPQRVERVEDVVKIGDQIMVKVVEIDRKAASTSRARRCSARPPATTARAHRCPSSEEPVGRAAATAHRAVAAGVRPAATERSDARLRGTQTGSRRCAGARFFHCGETNGRESAAPRNTMASRWQTKTFTPSMRAASCGRTGITSKQRAGSAACRPVTVRAAELIDSDRSAPPDRRSSPTRLAHGTTLPRKSEDRKRCRPAGG